MKKSKSRFMDPGGGYRAHTQIHKDKKDMILSKNEVEREIEEAIS
jgi:hypothetical protein